MGLAQRYLPLKLVTAMKGAAWSVTSSTRMLELFWKCSVIPLAAGGQAGSGCGRHGGKGGLPLVARLKQKHVRGLGL